MGATGTVTHVDGSRVYAFGHPFLGLGPASLALTRARVYAVIPSLDSSLKIAVLGPVIGTMTQDRATGIGGTLGAGPPELTINLTFTSARDPERRLQFKVLHDQTLTPLFAYVAVLNALAAFERQPGALTIATSGTASFGANGSVVIDDLFSGDGAVASAAAAATAAIGTAATNEFRPALAESLDLNAARVRARGDDDDRTRVARHDAAEDRRDPHAAGAGPRLPRRHRHARHPDHDAVAAGARSRCSCPTRPRCRRSKNANCVRAGRRPGRRSCTRLNSARRNNRLYVRLISSSAGTVVGGAALPGLPASVRSVFDEDKSVATAPVARTVVGAWEQRLTRVVRGSRELNLIVVAR